MPNRLADEAVRALGGQAVAMPISQVLLALSGRVINGCLDPWDAAPGLKLFDVLKAHTDFADAALSTTTFVLAMNRGVYDRLPRPLKSVIDANSGQPAAGMAGAMWDVEAAGAVALGAGARRRGHGAPAQGSFALAQSHRAGDRSVAEADEERRIDGDKLLADIRELLEKYAGEPEPPPPRPPPPPEKRSLRSRSRGREAKVEPPKPAAPAPAATPAAKPPPAAASRPKELDIPL